jgi:hypothetical protein
VQQQGAKNNQAVFEEKLAVNGVELALLKLQPRLLVHVVALAHVAHYAWLGGFASNSPAWHATGMSAASSQASAVAADRTKWVLVTIIMTLNIGDMIVLSCLRPGMMHAY